MIILGACEIADIDPKSNRHGASRFGTEMLRLLQSEWSGRCSAATLHVPLKLIKGPFSLQAALVGDVESGRLSILAGRARRKKYRARKYRETYQGTFGSDERSFSQIFREHPSIRGYCPNPSLERILEVEQQTIRSDLRRCSSRGPSVVRVLFRSFRRESLTDGLGCFDR